MRENEREDGGRERERGGRKRSKRERGDDRLLPKIFGRLMHTQGTISKPLTRNNKIQT